MRTRAATSLCICFFVVSSYSPALAGPIEESLPRAIKTFEQSESDFQNGESRRDSLWNGILIGAGVGAAVGMLIVPRQVCGANDTECATIVRVALGFPIIAGGIGVGALVDGLMFRGVEARIRF